MFEENDWKTIKKINVVVNINDDYVMPAITMLYSFYKHHTNYKLTVLILHSGLTYENMRIINEKLEKYFYIRFAKPSTKGICNMPITGHIALEAYLRIFAYQFFNIEDERVIYLDSDMIINGCLADFYFQEFDDNYLIACEDQTMSHIAKNIYNNLNMSINDKYFNSGLIIFNLKKFIKSETITEEICSYIKNNEKKIVFHDQDVLNGFFYKKSKIVTESKFNYFVTDVLSKKDRRNVLSVVKVLHFVDSWKPWKINYIGELSEEFWKYAKEIGFVCEYNQFIQNRSEKIMRKTKIKLYTKRYLKRFKIRISKVINMRL